MKPKTKVKAKSNRKANPWEKEITKGLEPHMKMNLKLHGERDIEQGKEDAIRCEPYLLLTISNLGEPCTPPLIL